MNPSTSCYPFLPKALCPQPSLKHEKGGHWSKHGYASHGLMTIISLSDHAI
jgi:hypothetical protein